MAKLIEDAELALRRAQRLDDLEEEGARRRELQSAADTAKFKRVISIEAQSEPLSKLEARMRARGERPMIAGRTYGEVVSHPAFRKREGQ